MMKKSLAYLILFFFLFQQFTEAIVLAQEENLSPIQILDWGLETESFIESSVESANDETVDVMTTETSDQMTLPEVTSPLELLEIIRTPGVQTSSNYNLIHFINGGIQMSMKAYVNQGDYGYLTYQEPPYMPRTLLIKAKKGQIEDSFMSVESLVTYATDAINNYPEIYEISPVKDLYVFAQESNKDFFDKYVLLDPDFDGAKEMYQEVNQLDAYLVDLLSDFISDHEADLEVGENPNLILLNLNDALSEEFSKLAKVFREDYPELDYLLTNFDQGVQGTLSFDLTTYEVGLGLISPVADGQTNGFEYYIRPVQLDVDIPNPEDIFSEQDFLDLLGFDVLNEIQEFEADTPIESFNLEGE